MNNSQKISKLVEKFDKSVQIFERKRVLGFIPFTLSCGWLWIEDECDCWAVTLANGKTTHDSLDGPALCVNFRKDNGERKVGPLHLTGAWKSTLSMWPIENEEEAIQVFNLIQSRVDLAFRLHFDGS